MGLEFRENCVAATVFLGTIGGPNANRLYPALFEFPPIEGRDVLSFDGGAITSDAGALLLGQTDRAIQLSERFAACFCDTRSAALVEHQVETMVCSASSVSRLATRT